MWFLFDNLPVPRVDIFSFSLSSVSCPLRMFYIRNKSIIDLQIFSIVLFGHSFVMRVIYCWIWAPISNCWFCLCVWVWTSWFRMNAGRNSILCLSKICLKIVFVILKSYILLKMRNSVSLYFLVNFYYLLFKLFIVS